MVHIRSDEGWRPLVAQQGTLGRLPASLSTNQKSFTCDVLEIGMMGAVLSPTQSLPRGAAVEMNVRGYKLAGVVTRTSAMSTGVTFQALDETASRELEALVRELLSETQSMLT